MGLSELKPQNSVTDNYRVFLPLNFFDLPMTFGPITEHFNYNGELITIQPRMVQQQYFNTRGVIEVNGASETAALIGDGTVMSRPGKMLTTIGSNNKWSFIKGRSDQGNDTAYWINAELKKVVRMGYDGTVSVSDVHQMQSFFANNLKWVNGIDTPAAGQGICGVWDQRYKEAIWTVMGKITGIPVYAGGTTYAINNVVQYTPAAFSTFEQSGEFYVSMSNGNVGNQPDISPASWALIPHGLGASIVVNGITYNSNQYYNEYTVAFNEAKNKFTSFYTFKPRIYLQWTDRFLTPMSNPSANTGQTYEHRLGTWCVWYGTNVQDGYITLLFNRDEVLMKEFFATMINSQIIPARIDFFTKDYQTFILGTDPNLQSYLDMWTAPIPNDILTSSNGQNANEDTSKIFGQYLKVKITYTNSVYQRLSDLVVKFMGTSRTYRT